MLEIKYVRNHLEKVQKALESRGQPNALDAFRSLDARRGNMLLEIETLRHQRNVVSETIAGLKQEGRDAQELVAEMRAVSAQIKDLDKAFAECDRSLNDLLMGLPNLPHASTPPGKDSGDNPVVKHAGLAPAFAFKPQPHWALGERLRILDFARAAKIAGARFPLYTGNGAKLERALINFMLDVHTTQHGYLEILPPFIVNRQSMTATGQLPKFEQDLFKLEGWDYFLIPTAEVPVTNIHQGEILDEADLPLNYTAYTPCFRSEAGSHGKDTRGLIRQHQFNKVELVKFTTPESSYDEQENLLHDAEEILQRLEIPYRVVALCTGDLGFAAAKTYDIEVWMPAQGVYREISSCSNFEDFQARRGNIRFRRKARKGTQFLHTLNGSGLAVGRTFAALLENFQQADGSVRLPKALHPYLGGMEVLSP